MSVKQFKLGKVHGQTGVKWLKHRNGRQYDSSSAQKSYDSGYSDGCNAKRTQLSTQRQEVAS